MNSSVWTYSPKLANYGDLKTVVLDSKSTV
jgi:hypothetical protein